MYTFFAQQEWDTRIEEFLYKLNTLLVDDDYEIKYDGYKVTKITPENHSIEYYNSRWDSYEGVCLSFATETARMKNSYVGNHSLSPHNLERETVDKVEIKKILEPKELFPEFCVYL